MKLDRKVIKFYMEYMIELLIINIVILLTWQKLELIIYQEIRPNFRDTIIGIILTLTLHNLYRKYIKNKLYKK